MNAESKQVFKKNKSILPRVKGSGFTIVELLVVIVVIGVLAAITIVSYTGITARANTAHAQSDANGVMKKVSIYNTDMGVNAPLSYGSLTGASPTTDYYLGSGYNFTGISGNKPMSAAVRAYAGNTVLIDSLDYTLCGANGTTTAPTSYVGITVPSGVIIGYWDNAGSGSLNTSDTVGVTTVGAFYPLTSSNPVACFKVGVAEAVAGYIKAYAAENAGAYPTTLADVNGNQHNVASAKLPAGVSITNTTVTSVTGLTQVNYTYLNGGGGARIVYWDYSTSALSTNTSGGTSIYLGSAVWNSTFNNPT